MSELLTKQAFLQGLAIALAPVLEPPKAADFKDDALGFAEAVQGFQKTQLAIALANQDFAKKLYDNIYPLVLATIRQDINNSQPGSAGQLVLATFRQDIQSQLGGVTGANRIINTQINQQATQIANQKITDLRVKIQSNGTRITDSYGQNQYLRIKLA